MSEFLLGAIVQFPACDCDRLLSLKNGDAVMIYLYMLRHGGTTPDSCAAGSMGLTEGRVNECIDLLSSSGIIQKKEASVIMPAESTVSTNALPKESDEIKKPPSYNASEIAGGLNRDASFRHVADKTGQVLGKILSSSDLEILYSIYDWRGFPPGVILLLVNFCAEQTHRKYGAEARPTMKQIDKEAALWEKKGIFSESAAEQHIHYLESINHEYSRLYKLLGIIGRTPSVTEQKYVSDWIGKGYSTQLIQKAYDITVTQKNKMAWSYCNAILENWRKNGLTTVAAVEESGRTAHKQKKTQTTQNLSPPGSSEREAVERMKAYLRKKRRTADD